MAYSSAASDPGKNYMVFLEKSIFQLLSNSGKHGIKPGPDVSRSAPGINLPGTVITVEKR